MLPHQEAAQPRFPIKKQHSPASPSRTEVQSHSPFKERGEKYSPTSPSRKKGEKYSLFFPSRKEAQCHFPFKEGSAVSLPLQEEKPSLTSPSKKKKHILASPSKKRSTASLLHQRREAQPRFSIKNFTQDMVNKSKQLSTAFPHSGTAMLFLPLLPLPWNQSETLPFTWCHSSSIPLFRFHSVLVNSTVACDFRYKALQTRVNSK